MSIEDNDNIYILEEEEEKDLDESPLNFAAYDHSKAEYEEKEEENDLPLEKKSAFGILFKIMFNPVEGWKTLRRSKITVENLQSGCFYPILALLAVSNFADFFYSVNVDLTEVVTKAVVSFVAFFFGYFGVMMVLSWFLPKDVAMKFEERFGKEYTIISLSTLAIFSIFTNLLPMLWPILIFLPIWTLYLMFKGVRFFHFPPQNETKFYIISVMAVIGIPILIDWVLITVLPY